MNGKRSDDRCAVKEAATSIPVVGWSILYYHPDSRAAGMGIHPVRLPQQADYAKPQNNGYSDGCSMHLRSKPFLSFIIDPFRRQARAFELRPDGVAIENGPCSSLSFEEMSSAPLMARGVLACSVALQTRATAPVKLQAVGRVAAEEFVRAAGAAWRETYLRRLSEEENRIDRLLEVIAEMESPKRYPSASSLNSAVEDAVDLENQLLSKLSTDAIGPEAAARLAPITRLAADPKGMREAAIDRFVEAELSCWNEFFDTVEAQPLTPEQRLSIVVDEDATLVLAGAGSGKTSVITAKAAYLINAGIRRPNEILLLAFARNAAKEMSERIEERCGMPVEARTFHALANHIIGAVEGRKPALAKQASDEMAFLSLIREILHSLVVADTKTGEIIIKWFAHFFDEPRNSWDFKTKHEWYLELEKIDLRTLQGEKVRSFEELQIANWLYRNGIAYEYEPVYEHPVPSNGKRVYQPDFRLTESGVYIEHFGVGRKRRQDGEYELVVAPFMERDDYLAGMKWKQEVHASHGTMLIETYSWERSEGRLLDALAEKVAPYARIKPRPAAEIYDRVVEMGEVDDFSSLLGTFLRHFKGGGYSLDDCAEKAGKLGMGERASAFLGIFSKVFQEYQKRLGDRIDFEDMVNRATEHVENNRYRSPFRHILIDEFQDISSGRARLVNALKAQIPDARVFAVGDDWQSIYRFAGSDIHIMRHFGSEFGGTFSGETGIHRTVDLGRTFRSVDKIALAAKQFVLRNPAQITKTVIPAGVAEAPAIQVVWTSKNTRNDQLQDVLASLAAGAVSRECRPNVMLLGRYRRLDPSTAGLQRNYPALNLSYKTIHASKGLEADHVILLGANSGRLGFPSEIVDDPILSLVSPESEPFEHGEERRVMYVAMTRARETLTIMASKAYPSAFARELLRDPSYGVSSPDSEDEPAYACGECGGRLLFTPSQTGRAWYRCEHRDLCGNRLPACSSCNAGLPRKAPGKAGMVCPQCGSSNQACPSCEDGWLVEREGKYGAFLGCVRYPDCLGKARSQRRRSLNNR